MLKQKSKFNALPGGPGHCHSMTKVTSKFEVQIMLRNQANSHLSDCQAPPEVKDSKKKKSQQLPMAVTLLQQMYQLQSQLGVD